MKYPVVLEAAGSAVIGEIGMRVDAAIEHTSVGGNVRPAILSDEVIHRTWEPVHADWLRAGRPEQVKADAGLPPFSCGQRENSIVGSEEERRAARAREEAHLLVCLTSVRL